MIDDGRYHANNKAYDTALYRIILDKLTNRNRLKTELIAPK